MQLNKKILLCALLFGTIGLTYASEPEPTPTPTPDIKTQKYYVNVDAKAHLVMTNMNTAPYGYNSGLECHEFKEGVPGNPCEYTDLDPVWNHAYKLEAGHTYELSQRYDAAAENSRPSLDLYVMSIMGQTTPITMYPNATTKEDAFFPPIDGSDGRYTKYSALLNYDFEPYMHLPVVTFKSVTIENTLTQAEVSFVPEDGSSVEVNGTVVYKPSTDLSFKPAPDTTAPIAVSATLPISSQNTVHETKNFVMNVVNGEVFASPSIDGVSVALDSTKTKFIINFPRYWKN